jgi:hypothetical protein
MRVVCAVVSLMLLTAGCARKPPEAPQPTPVSQLPAPAKPASPSPAAPKSTPAKPAAPSPPAPKAAPSKPAAAAKPTKTAPPPRPATPALDLVALKERLKATKAIGLMTKLTLKNQVDDLLDRFRGHYAGKDNLTMKQLRQSYDLLMMKVLSLLQDKDQMLASDIVASREVIWGLLADPKKFAALDV